MRLRGSLIAAMALIVTAFLAAPPAQAQEPIVLPPPAVVPPLPSGTKTRPVQLVRLVLKIARNQPFGRFKVGLLCVGGGTLRWRGGRVGLENEEFDNAFRESLGEIGFDVLGKSGDLFDDGGDRSAEYLVGGTIKAMRVDTCLPQSGLGDSWTAKGTAWLEIEWQLYNRLDRRVVVAFTTRTGVVQKKAQWGGIQAMILAAFEENVRAFAAAGVLQRYLVGEPADMTIARRPGSNLPPLAIALPKAGVATLGDAVGATILVQSGDGHGSGFLISSDGYFLTSQHVVGGARFVKLRWSDGLETLGEVVRADKGRDIALIKGDARRRVPIKLRAALPEAGTAVFAVGAPLDKTLQNTMTRGIVSARRVIDGYSFIQSDTSVAPGNSGGPLIDEKGALVGITVSSMRIADAPQGINFFIPAAEAFEFLAITASADRR